MGKEQKMKGGKGEPKGVLAVWNDLDPKIETDYHQWYWQEHLLMIRL